MITYYEVRKKLIELAKEHGLVVHQLRFVKKDIIDFGKQIRTTYDPTDPGWIYWNIGDKKYMISGCDKVEDMYEFLESYISTGRLENVLPKN